MTPWKPGDRVHHASYGAGTILEFNDRHAVVHFDTHGRRTFAAHLVVLSASAQPVQAPQTRRSGMTSERTTDVGYENLNEQRVARAVSGGGTVRCVLSCRRCGAEYGVAADEILLRRCPSCMGGPAGLGF